MIMGLFATLLSKARSFDVDASDGVVDRTENKVQEFIRRCGDEPLPTAYAAKNAVWTIASDPNIDGGTYTITVTLWDGTTYTTANIAFGADAATIEAALDTASPVGIADGAISVSGGNIATADVVLTFDGADVDGGRHTASITSALTDGGIPVTDPAVTETTAGQEGREPWAALKVLGVITDAAPPDQGVAGIPTAGPNLHNVPPWFIRAMSAEAAVQDKNAAVESVINIAVLGYNRG